MKDQSEKVSIIIPTYKRPFFLKKVIENLNNQTYKNLEIIIVDDNKKDSLEKKQTYDEVKKIIENYNHLKIKYISNLDNQGANYSRNIGIKNADGKFISFLDDDDEYINTRIEIMLKKIRNSDYDMICCSWKKILFKGNEIKKISEKNISDDYNVLLDDILTNNIIGGASLILVKREVFETLGGFDINLVSCQDWDLFIRMVKSKYKILKIKDKLVKYNMHLEERISTNREKVIKGHLSIKKKYQSDRKNMIFKNKILFELKIIKHYIKYYINWN